MVSGGPGWIGPDGVPKPGVSAADGGIVAAGFAAVVVVGESPATADAVVTGGVMRGAGTRWPELGELA